MVLQRQCSFCAGEIEPGTGLMFVKRDGTIFHFCSSSCRRQQLFLGRMGHRLKWTRAHAMKRAQAHSAAKSAAPAGPAGREGRAALRARKRSGAPPPASAAPSTGQPEEKPEAAAAPAAAPEVAKPRRKPTRKSGAAKGKEAA